MKRFASFQHIVQIMVAGSVLCHPASALAGKRHFEARCQASEGSQFVLRAEYDYSVLALGHTSKMSMVSDWEVYYSPGTRWGKLIKAPALIRYAGSTAPDCDKMGVIDGVPVVSQSFLQSDGSWYPVKSLPAHQYLSSYPPEQPEPVRRQLERRGLFVLDDFTLLAPLKGRLVFEQPLFSHQAQANGHSHVGAVYQSTSSDKGKSWSPAIVTEHAELFEIGKPLAEQRYAARLLPQQTSAR